MDKIFTILRNRLEAMEDELNGTPIDFSNYDLMLKIRAAERAKSVIDELSMLIDYDEIHFDAEKMLRDEDFPETLDEIYLNAEKDESFDGNFRCDVEAVYEW